VAHHLFFTQIPHYNLPEATEVSLPRHQSMSEAMWKSPLLWAWVRRWLRVS
jgi:fatty acid desaturase